MTGKYDITKDGEKIGTLRVGKQGAYTLFSAECELFPGIFRLSVYGQGKEGYLGVLIPEGGRMRLEKKLSPSAMRAFPEEIEFAGQAGGMQIRKENMQPLAEPKPEPEPEPEKEEPLQDDEECMAENGPFWYASPDGALVSADNGREMVALPLGDERVPKNIPGESRVIEGREYLVYIAKELA